MKFESHDMGFARDEASRDNSMYRDNSKIEDEKCCAPSKRVGAVKGGAVRLLRVCAISECQDTHLSSNHLRMVFARRSEYLFLIIPDAQLSAAPL